MSTATPVSGSAGSTDVAWSEFLRDWNGTDDYSTLARLSRRATALLDDPERASRLVPLRLAIASTSTVDFILPVLRAALATLGVRATVETAPYGQIGATLLDADATVARFQPQVTVLLCAAPQVLAWPALTDSLADVERRVDEVCRELLGPCELFHQRTGSEILLTNFHALPWRAAGNLGARLPGDPVSFVRRLNLRLGDTAPRFVHIFDVAALAERAGTESWFDERYWHLAKQPIGFEVVPHFVRCLAASIAAVIGRARKCLVLDLDNTLWGGVIGDDGVSGIRIGEGDPTAEAFKAFQRYLAELKQRGVLLAVCSKNDDAVAREPFVRHPEMVLQLDDFAAFAANWQPKSDNIRAIARQLDLPLEAIAFVDDNPAERDEVARALPEVAVPALPEDPALYVRALDRHVLFEAVRLTDEDLQRTTTYHARRRSQEALAQTTDLREYLSSLQMVGIVEPFTPAAVDRITQLVNKTNQFNLTTPRLVRAEVERLAAAPDAVTRTVRLRDRFGDHGLISVLFGRITEQSLIIDAWLMSCRVLGRGVERLLFNDLLTAASARGVEELVGLYQPTARNGLVKEHYAGLGFTRDRTEEGVERWRLRVDEARPSETFIALRIPETDE